MGAGGGCPRGRCRSHGRAGRGKLSVLQVPVLAVRELKKRLGEIASDFFSRPSEHMMGTAVTGTNGKTSISHWTARLLSVLHHPCAAVGTMGCFYMGEKIPSPALTTPDAASTQDLFSNLYGRGCQAFCIEASSIGLVQGVLTERPFIRRPSPTSRGIISIITARCRPMKKPRLCF